MISFSHQAIRPNLNEQNSNENISTRQVNNYETVEYEASKYNAAAALHRQPNSHYNQEKDTFDLYSYQDNNNIYVEDDDDKKSNTLKANEQNNLETYIKVTPVMTNNENVKYVVDLNDLRNHLNSSNQHQNHSQPNQIQTLNRFNNQAQVYQMNNEGIMQSMSMNRMNTSTLPNQTHYQHQHQHQNQNKNQHQHQQQQQQHIYQKSLECQSIMPTLNRLNSPVIVNQPHVYQKSLDNFTMDSMPSEKTHIQQPIFDQSMDSQSFNPTINRSVYNYSSNTQLNKSNIGESPNVINKTTKNNIQLGSGCCFFRFIFSIFGFFCSCLQCFTNCCFRPCCSTAAILAGFTGLGGLLAGIMVMGVVGVLPLPVEFTKNICNMDRHRTFINYNDNQTNFNVSTQFFDTNNTNHDVFYVNNNHTILNYSTDTTLTTAASNSTSYLKKKAKFRNKLKIQNKLKHRSPKFAPLQYDILFMPTVQDELYDLDIKFNMIMEMRINMNIKIYCYNSTNIIQLSTPEFSNIELSFEKIADEDSLSVKKWSYDSSSDILEIEASKNFTSNSLYKLNIFILYKNYGSNSLTTNQKQKQAQQFYYLSFNDKFENPFPVVVESNNQFKTYSGPSVFNVSFVKSRPNQNLIFNMEISNINKQANSEIINYKTTPFVPVQTIGIIIGGFLCKQNDDENFSIKLRVCTTIQSNYIIFESFDIIIENVKSLLRFFKNYTKIEYILRKLDIVILPSDAILELANDDQSLAQLGIIYLPQFFLENLKTDDSLERSQVKLKIVHIISKQLAKHWFYKYQECNNEMNLFKDLNENDFTVDTLYLVKSLCAESKNLTFCSNKDLADQDQSFNTFLQYNVNCYLFKGIVNWISYLGFKSINPELFDLVFLEWSLIRELDETYFFSNSNIKYIYQAYDFPRLTESNNLQKIKTEIKGLLSARSISLLFGKDRFQSFVNEWFKSIQSSDESILMALNQSKTINLKNLIGFNKNMNENSILDLLEKYTSQYNIISLPKVEFKDVIKSWILAPNNVVLSMNRNYNKKDALVNLDYSNNSIISDIYFPLNWLSGTMKTSEDGSMDVFNLKEDDNFNIKWLNQSNDNIKDLPGADKWVIGNYMKMFGELRVNYDEQNWLMLVKQLLINYKSLNVNDRAQLIDDAFYLANNQKMPIAYALNILEYIPKEDNFLPWKYVIKNVKNIINYIEDDSQVFSKFRIYLINLIKPTYHQLQWGEEPSDTMDKKLIRILVVDLLCSLDYEDCVEKSVKQLSDLININVNNIPRYLRKSIYCTAIRYSGINEWLFMWKYYLQQSDGSNMKESLLYSLSCSSHIWILNLFLRKLVYENSYPIENLPKVFDYISQNPVGKYISWNHISQNYQIFYNKIGNDPDLFLKILQVSTKELKFKYEIKQFYDFIEEIGSKNITFYYSKNNKDKLLSNIEARINRYSIWKNSNVNDLNEWLSQKKVTEFKNLRSSDL